MKTSAALLLSFAVLVCAAPAHAQSSQGRVVVPSAVIWRPDAPIVLATAKAGTVLDLTGRSDRWYEVIIPAALGGGGGARGLIARSQIELLPGSPQPPLIALRGQGGATATSPAQPRRRVAARRPRPMLPGFIHASGGYFGMTSDVQERVTFTENVEQGQFSTESSASSGPSFDIGAGSLITPRIGLGAAVTRFSERTTAAVTGEVPHPFFFNQPRPISGTATGLKNEELAVHGQLRVVAPVGRQIRVAAFGGPSLFRVSRAVVTALNYTQVYPYDQATFASAASEVSTKTAVGFNAGGDAAYFFTPKVGVGFTVMYSRASLTLPTVGDQTVDITAGGLHTGGGLRLRF